jgi:hypothetical protein
MLSGRVSFEGESDIYRDLMRFRPDGLSPNAWAVKAGVSRTVWNDMRRHGNPSRRTLEKLLTAAGSSLAEFEALRLGPELRPQGASAGQLGEAAPRWTPAPLPPLPLLASRLAGKWPSAAGDVDLIEVRTASVLEHLPRPMSLATDREAFTLIVDGSTMWPRFRPGMRIALSPRSPVSVGDDVLIFLAAPEPRDGTDVQRALIGQLVEQDKTRIELRQFNPDMSFQVHAANVDRLIRIAGELI